MLYFIVRNPVAIVVGIDIAVIGIPRHPDRLRQLLHRSLDRLHPHLLRLLHVRKTRRRKPITLMKINRRDLKHRPSKFKQDKNLSLPFYQRNKV